MIVDPNVPQAQPLPNPKQIIGSDEILGHVDNAVQSMKPEAQAAVSHAHELLGLNNPLELAQASGPSTSVTSQMAAPMPSESPLPARTPSISPSQMVGTSPLRAVGTDGNLMTPPVDSQPGAGSFSSSAASPTALQASSATPLPSVRVPSQADSELARVTGRGNNPNEGKSGIAQIHNPWLRGLATVGDVIASGLYPGFGQFIPGTSAHHNLQVVPQTEQAVADEQRGQKVQDESRLQNAQATEQESLPQLHKAQSDLSASKIDNAKEVTDEKQRTADAKQALSEAEAERKRGESQQKIAAGLAEHGLKMDADTKQLIPLPYAEMSEPQKAAHDLKAAQAELTTARRDYVQAQKDGIPAAQELAQKRVAAAQASAATAAGRLGLSRDEFNAQFLGIAPGGEQLAGGETDDAGRPVGTKLAAANKPGAAAQGRASQAESIIEAGNNLKTEIDKHKDKVGNIGSYWNQFVNGSPIADPDAARLMTEIASYAALQPAMHGMRGGQVMKEFEKMVGGIPKNPEALKAAIDGIANTATVMAKQGQSRGSHSSSGQGVKGDVNQIPDAVRAVMSKADPGVHTLSDGTKWMKAADGTITPQK